MQPAPRSRVSRKTAAPLALVLCALPFAAAPGQQPPPTPGAAPAPAVAAPARPIPRPGDLEPGVNTSAVTPPSAAGGASAPAAASAPGAAAASARPSAPSAAPSSSNPEAKAASAARSPSQGPPGSAGATDAKASARKGADRLQLDATEITGNRELPKVLYIVPWKHSDLGDVVGKPVNSLVDEVLQPLDRDVFQRENRYYDALSPAANAQKPGAVPGSGNKP
jgi:hypothetical protein